MMKVSPKTVRNHIFEEGIVSNTREKVRWTWSSKEDKAVSSVGSLLIAPSHPTADTNVKGKTTIVIGKKKKPLVDSV